MLMGARKYSVANTNYRYGFNGKENDNHIVSGAQDYGMRIYDSRLGKFLSVDPLTALYPWYTPYQFAGNGPIANIDLDGGEPKPSTNGTQEGQSQTTSETSYATLHNIPKTITETWNWHAGGLKTGKYQKNSDGTMGAEILTQAGWYTSVDYVNVLKSSSAAGALAEELPHFGASISVSSATFVQI